MDQEMKIVQQRRQQMLTVRLVDITDHAHENRLFLHNEHRVAGPSGGQIIGSFLCDRFTLQADVMKKMQRFAGDQYLC